MLHRLSKLKKLLECTCHTFTISCRQSTRSVGKILSLTAHRHLHHRSNDWRKDYHDNSDDIHGWMNIISTITTKEEDRKSTRLNSSHMSISYAVFCLKKI